jgi:hypothetical protein
LPGAAGVGVTRSARCPSSCILPACCLSLVASCSGGALACLRSRCWRIAWRRACCCRTTRRWRATAARRSRRSTRACSSWVRCAGRLGTAAPVQPAGQRGGQPLGCGMDTSLFLSCCGSGGGVGLTIGLWSPDQCAAACYYKSATTFVLLLGHLLEPAWLRAAQYSEPQCILGAVVTAGKLVLGCICSSGVQHCWVRMLCPLCRVSQGP